MGRKSIYNDDLALEILLHLEGGLSIADSCAIVGIDETTYHDWVKKGDEQPEQYPALLEFSQLTRMARARGRKTHVDKIVRADDWRAAAFFLERSDPKNWGPKHEVKTDITSKGESVQTVIYLPDNGRNPDSTTATSCDPPAIGSPDDLPL